MLKEREEEQRHALTTQEMTDTTPLWNIIGTQFKDNPAYLVQQHLDSYNRFYAAEIMNIFRDNNPIRFVEREFVPDEEIAHTAAALKSLNEQRATCTIWMGGKNADRIYYGKPVLYNDTVSADQKNEFIQYLYPNDARIRNMTYGFTIHYDIEVETTYYENEDKPVTTNRVYEKIYLGRFPIMVQSNQCILDGLSREARFNFGECRNDFGGYFIINGKEKLIVSQEKMADNMVLVQKVTTSDTNPFSLTCDIHSVSEDTSKPIRYMSVKMFAEEGHIVAFVPMAAKPIPLFILMRALGVVSDKEIIEYCLLDIEKNSDMVDLFIPSIHDAGTVFTQSAAIEYISQLFMKRGTITETFNILMNYFLPHVGENNFIDKAYFLGNMVFKMLRVHLARDPPSDRDNFKYKRIETSGTLIRDLFREYWIIQNQAFFVRLDKELYYKRELYGVKNTVIQEGIRRLADGIPGMLSSNRLVEKGFAKGFRGNWGAGKFTRRVGLVQDLNRLSWSSFMSHLRKTVLHIELSAKIVAPHLLQNSQWGMFDPLDSPDGGDVGLHKHLTLSVAITNQVSSAKVMEFLKENLNIRPIQQFPPLFLSTRPKIFVNGIWFGVVMDSDPLEVIRTLKRWRRNGLLPLHMSVSFNFSEYAIYIYTDGGRLTRPYVYRKHGTGEISYYAQRKRLTDNNSNPVSWKELVNGSFSLNKKVNYDDCTSTKSSNAEQVKHEGILEYLDVAEEENALIANNMHNFTAASADTMAADYTHMEIDPSLILGVMGNCIIFPEHNQLPRNVFSCGQSRQACSLYNSNYPVRMDKTGIVLNYGQIPLIKSKYLKYINHEEMPYGVNTIVAIMSYTGYNVEDAILINRASLDRGLFNTSYYTTYENSEIDYGGDEEGDQQQGLETGKMMFSNPLNVPNVVGMNQNANYNHLNKDGFVDEGTVITDKTVIIGKVVQSEDGTTYTDNSKTVKKGQMGVVDKIYVTEGAPGNRIAKVRICHSRYPAIGDKMASRAGQKGTIGLIVPEEDMPFNAEGVRPDIIINPHALPSRMTIGHLIESIFGKVCAEYGTFGDCTAFGANGINYHQYGDMLQKVGLHSSGDEVLYSGFTGEQVEANIYMGPTYYMRLKHMVKDKINYRATGKRDALTRQTNQGRADDGGLRVGEMERDSILSHGAAFFLTESFMERGDEYFLAVCNKTGAIAIYNPAQDIYFSPFADGPVSFHEMMDPLGVPTQNIQFQTRFGRSFSIVRIPYSFKLLIQELQAMNVQMRIITDDNVDQLVNLGYESKQSIENRRVTEQLKRHLTKQGKGKGKRGGADGSDSDSDSDSSSSNSSSDSEEEEEEEEKERYPYKPFKLFYSEPLAMYYGVYDHSNAVIDFTKIATEIALRQHLTENHLNKYEQQLTPDGTETVWVNTETQQIEPENSIELRPYNLDYFSQWFSLPTDSKHKMYENQLIQLTNLVNQKLDAAETVPTTVLPALTAYVSKELDEDQTMYLGDYFDKAVSAAEPLDKEKLGTYQYTELDQLLEILSLANDVENNQNNDDGPTIMPAFTDQYLLTSFFRFPPEIQTQVLSVPAKDQELFVRGLIERNEQKKRRAAENASNNILLKVDDLDGDDDDKKEGEDGGTTGEVKSIIV
jgi:DNA-directed RNA polymerase II subunit RPB2